MRVEGNFFGGESLIIGRDDILVDDFRTDVVTETGTVWYISGSGDDYSQLPAEWEQAQILYSENDFKITRFITR